MQKFIAIIMAVIVLLTTTSFSVNMHFCGKNLIDFSFFQNARTCGMENIKQVNKACDNPVISQKPCCSDQQIIIDGQDNFQDSYNKITFEQLVFLTAFAYNYIYDDNINDNKYSFTVYIPPFVKRDVQVLHQSFLI